MANDLQGEVRFTALGREFLLKFGAKAMREVETATGRSITVLGADMNDPERGGFKLLSTVFLACLRHHQPTVTAAEVDEIFDEIDMDQLGDLLGQAINRGQPARPGGPPKAARARR